MDTIITYFSDPIWRDIAHIHSWILAALAYAMVIVLIVRYCGVDSKHTHVGTPIEPIPSNPHGVALGACPGCGHETRYLTPAPVGWRCAPCCTTVTYEDTGEPVPSVPLTPHEQYLWEERVAPYRDGVPHPHSPAHYSQPTPMPNIHDINMDDPNWVQALEDELS